MGCKGWHFVMVSLGLLISGNFSGTVTAYSVQQMVPEREKTSVDYPFTPGCPVTLIDLQPRLEEVLRNIHSSSFREIMGKALWASIPDAIEQADGLVQTMAALREEIIRQEQEQIRVEQVARENGVDTGQPLKPCSQVQESSYCYAVEQYYVATAANLANRAFLEALECYQRAGVR